MKKASNNSQTPFNLPTQPLFLVISGPSGVGKDAVLAKIQKSNSSIERIITVTTRPPRDREKNNADYYFVLTERFEEMIEHKELLEWATVYGNWYGVPKEPIKQALDRGQDIIVKVDIQGAATIKNIVPQAVFIFLTPSSVEELALRLNQRQSESPPNLALRLKTAEEEIRQLPLFDYIVFNQQGEIDLAVSEIKAIITAEKCRVTPRKITL